MPLIDLVHVEDPERYTAETAKLGQGAQEAVSFEARFRTRDGSYRWMLWNSMAGVDDDLIYAAARDITDRKQQDAALEAIDAELRVLSAELEVRVEQRTGELAAANKELEAFSYSVSHDLRAPLRAIDGYSLAIVEDYGPDLPGPVQADLGRVRAASQRMSLMIDEMLALSRVTRQELLDEPVDLTALADDVADELRTQETDATWRSRSNRA
jgi:signal transduction histidine kinase